jgi:hypothetical protein
MTTKEEAVLLKIGKDVADELYSIHQTYPQMSPMMFIKIALHVVGVTPPPEAMTDDIRITGVFLNFLTDGNLAGAFIAEDC